MQIHLIWIKGFINLINITTGTKNIEAKFTRGDCIREDLKINDTTRTVELKNWLNYLKKNS